MRVKIYDYNQDTGAEALRDECELVDAFGDGKADPEYSLALRELATVGRYWIGGGASPLVLLMRAGIAVSVPEPRRVAADPAEPYRQALSYLVDVVETALDAGLMLSVDGKRPEIVGLQHARELLGRG